MCGGHRVGKGRGSPQRDEGTIYTGREETYREGEEWSRGELSHRIRIGKELVGAEKNKKKLKERGTG